GAEKFFDIKCRLAGLRPDAALVVATVRALKYHGGIPVPELGGENEKALMRGLDNLEAHVEAVRQVKGPLLLRPNPHPTDTHADPQARVGRCAALRGSAYRAY